MKILQLLLEFVSRMAFVFFILLISLVFYTFVVSMFLPNLSTSLKYVSAIVAALTVITALYALFVRLDKDEKLWDIIPNPLDKKAK